MSPPAVRPVGGSLAPAAIGAAYRLLSSSWRLRVCGRQLLEEALSSGPTLVVCWHGDLLASMAAHAGRGLVGLASQSRDGELIARILPRFGYGVVRGSSSRGGMAAVRQCLRHLEQGRSLAITVDGPRGPRHTVQPGALMLSALSGRPIVYVAADARPAVRLGSWDRMLVPAPFARVDIRYGRMASPDRHSLSAAQAALESQMRALSREGAARRRADRGTAP